MPQILVFYLDLMKQVDHEELTVNLQSIIDIYHNDIHPYAVELANGLMNQVKRSLIKEFEAEQFNSQEVEMPENYLCAVERLIHSTSSNTQLVTQLGNVVLPHLHEIISGMYHNSIEESIDCACLLMMSQQKPLGDWYLKILNQLNLIVELDKDEDMQIVSVKKVVNFI